MTDKMPRRVLYLNGLERNQAANPEKSLSRYLRSADVEVTDVPIDWHSGLTFKELFDRTTEFVKKEIQKHGRIALIGASAGGSLGVNVFQRIRGDQPDLEASLVSLSSRLKVGGPATSLEGDMSPPGQRPSQAYTESVLRCEGTVVPELSDLDKQLIRTVRPIADQLVPLNTMGIDGVESYVVPESGHVRGIRGGALLVPAILADIYAHKQ